MRVFVTGATGFIGSAVVQELIGAGHQVLGLARNDAAVDTLARLGVEVHRGDLTDTDSLAAGARVCDGVIHTAFIHDFSNIAASGVTDRIAIEALGGALAGSGRPLVVTSGTGQLAPDRPGTEDDASISAGGANHRLPSDETTLALVTRGVRSALLRLPPSVHGKGDHGFAAALIGIAREKGVSAYVGHGRNCWASVHLLDAARLFRLVLEQGIAGARYHGVAEQGVPTGDIAAVIGRRLDVPVVAKSAEEAMAHFGWLGRIFSADWQASSTKTQAELGWRPTQPGLIADLDQNYFDIPPNRALVSDQASGTAINQSRETI